MHEETATTSGVRSIASISGAILIAAPLAMVAGMALHPSPHGHGDLPALLREIAGWANMNRSVHGALIGVLSVVLLGFWGFSAALGFNRILVRAGMLAFALGTVALIAAATINGFVLSSLALSYHEAKPETIESMRPILVLCMEGNHACDHLGIFFLSAAVGCWSLALLGRGGSLWSIGAAGLVIGIGAPVALVAGAMPMTVHGFGAFVVAQAIWYVAVGVQLFKGRI